VRGEPLHPDRLPLVEPPVGDRRKQHQRLAVLVDEHVPQQHRVVTGARHVRDRVGPCGAALVEDALGEGVRLCRMEERPIEVLHHPLIIPQRQVGHRRVGAHVGVDRPGRASPLDRTLDVSPAEILAHVVDESHHTRVVPIEDRRRPEGLRVAPMCAGSLPARREVREARAAPSRVDGLPVGGRLREKLGGFVVPPQGLGRLRCAEEAAKVPEVVAHDVVLAIP